MSILGFPDVRIVHLLAFALLGIRGARFPRPGYDKASLVPNWTSPLSNRADRKQSVIHSRRRSTAAVARANHYQAGR